MIRRTTQNHWLLGRNYGTVCLIQVIIQAWKVSGSATRSATKCHHHSPVNVLKARAFRLHRFYHSPVLCMMSDCDGCTFITQPRQDSVNEDDTTGNMTQ